MQTSECFRDFARGLDRLGDDLSLQSRLAATSACSTFASAHADSICRIEETLRLCEDDIRFVEGQLAAQEANVHRLRQLRDKYQAQNGAAQSLLPCIQQRFPGGATVNLEEAGAETASPVKRSAPASAAASDASDSQPLPGFVAQMENRQHLGNAVLTGGAVPTGGAAPAQNPSAAAKPTTSRRAPRAYISKPELASCSSYMVGRLTVEKVNAALEECAEFAEGNHRMMATYRKKPGALGAADRARALDVSRVITANPTMKGSFWFLESDLKCGRAIKMDNTGKSLLQLLRQLKRLTEVRGKVGKSTVSLYTMPVVE